MEFRTRTSLCVLFVVFRLTLPLLSQLPPSSSNSAFEEQAKQGRDALSSAKYSDAISAFKKANKLQNDSCVDCYLGLATASLHLGKPQEVLENSDKALQFATTDSQRVFAHNLKGSALVMGKPDTGKLEQAATEFRAAIALSPSPPALHLNLAKVLLKQSKDDEARAELQKCLALKPDAAMTEQAKKFIAEPKLGREDLAPPFQITSMQGEKISLRQLTGKVVVLDFWATWCPPCRDSVPELKELTRKYPSEKLTVISISADDDEKAWQEFVAKKDMDWPQFRDSNRQIRISFGVRLLPTYLVIDGDGAIQERIEGRNPHQTIVYRLRDKLNAMPELNDDRKN
jgi:thiol-disulfide isomerase/thioredoxin